ncbi:hypothetical protein FHS78_000661 [Parvibaculum indicum]|uniref:hypothetical protein n=1 Tax=Parvibaculum indicum TaxID=562969 RepID=UPI00141E91B0|nr:hypothetical protein [Parvibaculum indicum]NIJ40391.1 hypothetical protein [Parvibaculum indicum]
MSAAPSAIAAAQAPESRRDALRRQARAWARKIPASEKDEFIDTARRMRDFPPRGGTNAKYLTRKVHLICGLYPWPVNEALRTAADIRLKKLAGGTEAYDSQLAYDLITELLETPDALLD